MCSAIAGVMCSRMLCWPKHAVDTPTSCVYIMTSLLPPPPSC
jgi:hypothetical protein